MKKNIISFGIFAITTIGAQAQEVKEVVQPLSPKAAKGYLYNAAKDAAGNSIITYKIPGPKKAMKYFLKNILLIKT